MKTAILAAACLLATAASAQTITHIARYADHTVALSDMTCPNSSWQKTAVFNSYGADRGQAYGCWSGSTSSGHVSIRWFRLNTSRTPPSSVPSSDLQIANE